MLKLFSQLFGSKSRRSSADTAAAHWSQWQAQADAQKPKWVDWGDHPTFLDLIYAEHFGAKEVTLFHYLKQQYPNFSNCKALSLCSGDGTFENLLSQNGIFGAITGIDISPYRVNKAIQDHASANAKLDFIVGDINAGNYGHGAYDIVFAKAALHHIEALEVAFKGMRQCLKPSGYLVTIDFFGPTRFQWTDQQLAQANLLLHDIPEQLRTDKKGNMKTVITRPTIDEMIAADPSEAVRSSEVYGFIQQHFKILNEFAIGGTVFNLIFTSDIIDNFDPADAAHQELIRTIYHKERALIAAGELPSDFKFIIAVKH